MLIKLSELEHIKLLVDRSSNWEFWIVWNSSIQVTFSPLKRRLQLYFEGQLSNLALLQVLTSAYRILGTWDHNELWKQSMRFHHPLQLFLSLAVFLSIILTIFLKLKEHRNPHNPIWQHSKAQQWPKWFVQQISSARIAPSRQQKLIFTTHPIPLPRHSIT